MPSTLLFTGERITELLAWLGDFMSTTVSPRPLPDLRACIGPDHDPATAACSSEELPSSPAMTRMERRPTTATNRTMPVNVMDNLWGAVNHDCTAAPAAPPNRREPPPVILEAAGVKRFGGLVAVDSA